MDSYALAQHQLIGVFNGSPKWKETVSPATGASARNATPFNGGQVIAFQSDVAVTFKTGDSAVVATADDFSAAAGQVVVVRLPRSDTHIAFRPVGASGAAVKLGKME